MNEYFFLSVTFNRRSVWQMIKAFKHTVVSIGQLNQFVSIIFD